MKVRSLTLEKQETGCKGSLGCRDRECDFPDYVRVALWRTHPIRGKTKLTGWVSVLFSLSCGSSRRWQSATSTPSAPLPSFTSPCVWAQTPDLKFLPPHPTCSKSIARWNLPASSYRGKRKQITHRKLHKENIWSTHAEVKDTQLSKCQNGSEAKLGGDGVSWCCSGMAFVYIV